MARFNETHRRAFTALNRMDRSTLSVPPNHDEQEEYPVLDEKLQNLRTAIEDYMCSVKHQLDTGQGYNHK